ncbi:MFS transporter [Saccharopolyspora hattusasensis]|uniref:MFS transporter n=1 Tax=Saccharopolyspora hattusasensis TaxID=1128679 RepID=UPI003D97BC14
MNNRKSDRGAARRAVAAGIVGSALEWYDFSLYGSAAALVFGPLFFPNFSPLAGTLAAFATYAAGFLARPLGGILFGNLGDKIGRKAVLLTTILLMGSATVLIGLLPTYQTIGIWAPILLLLMRLLQGLGSGAEQGGAMLMAAEHAPVGKRGLYTSLPFVGIFSGILLAAGIFGAFSSMSQEQFLAWGWRAPFVLSIVVIAIGLYIRLRVGETPAFTQVKQTRVEASIPMVDAVRSSWKHILLGIGARMGETGGSYLFQVFILTYVTQIGAAENIGLIGVLIGSAAALVALPLFGALTDRVGRRPVYAGGALFAALFAFPYFWLLDSRTPALIWLAGAVSIGVCISSMLAAQAAMFPELFPARVRYSGVALARELSAPISGGIAPFIATALLAASGGDPWPVAVYLIVLQLITLTSVIFLPETYRIDLTPSVDKNDGSRARTEHT